MLNYIDVPAEALAETYRIKLGLLPWDKYESERLEAIEKNCRNDYTDTYVDYMKMRKRQCGKSTRGMLRALAEAVLTKRPILVNGPSREIINTSYRRVQELAMKLGLAVKVQKTTRPMTIFSDHTTFEL